MSSGGRTTLRLRDPLLWLRAATLSGVVLGVGAASHLAADGMLPSASVMLSLAGAGTMASLWFMVRPLGPVLMVSLVLAGQTVVHLGLSLSAGHHGEHLRGVTGPLDLALLQLEHVAEQGVSMFLAHTAAAAVVGLWLAWAEAALWRVVGHGLALVRLLFPRLVELVQPAPGVRSSPAWPAIGARRQRWALIGPIARRGPPLLTV